MGPVWVLWPPPTQFKDIQVWLIQDSKLPVDENVGKSGGLSVCVNPVMSWCPPPSPHISWDQLQPPVTLQRIGGSR